MNIRTKRPQATNLSLIESLIEPVFHHSPFRTLLAIGVVPVIFNGVLITCTYGSLRVATHSEAPLMGSKQVGRWRGQDLQV